MAGSPGSYFVYLKVCLKEWSRNGPNLNLILFDFALFLSGGFISSIFLEPTTEQEICASFRAETSAGFHQVTMDVVKQTIDLIIGSLTDIMNLSLSSGIVPEQMKVARVIPLFKSGILSLLTNYRPVSGYRESAEKVCTNSKNPSQARITQPTSEQHKQGVKTYLRSERHNFGLTNITKA